MRTFSALAAATLLAAGTAAFAAPPVQDVNLDGSVGANSSGNAGARAARGPTLAASATRQLNAEDVPSRRLQPGDLKAQADADIDRREHPVTPRLAAERENLKGADAKASLAQQQTPANYDRSIQMGDKDHTEQVTDVKVYLKK